jgi:hypothetical protein
MKISSKQVLWITIGVVVLQKLLAVTIGTIWHPELHPNDITMLKWEWECYQLSLSIFFGFSALGCLLVGAEKNKRGPLIWGGLIFAFHLVVVFYRPLSGFDAVLKNSYHPTTGQQLFLCIYYLQLLIVWSAVVYALWFILDKDWHSRLSTN